MFLFYMAWRELALCEQQSDPGLWRGRIFDSEAAVAFEWLPRYSWSPLETDSAGPRKDEEGFLICSEIFISAEMQYLEVMVMKIKLEQSG